MRLALRTRLLAVVASLVLAFAVIVTVSTTVTRDVERELLDIQTRQIPRLEIGPTLQGEFALLKRSYQDAVAAHDPAALERSSEARDRIVAELERGRDVLDPAVAAEFRRALDVYHDAAYDVSRRMLAGQGGEDAVDSIAAMQRKLFEAQALLDRLSAFDHKALKTAFDRAYTLEHDGSKTRLGVMVACVVAVVILTLANTRRILRSLSQLEAGFVRFGAGRLSEAIETSGDDELAAVARGANRLARGLADAAVEREHRDWVTSGLMQLADELRGELDEHEVAMRVARTLARRLEVTAVALYARDASDERLLRLRGHHALVPGLDAGDAQPTVLIGEGLVGEAASGTTPITVDDLPPGFLRIRSGLGATDVRRLLLVPLFVDGRVWGVLEIASFEAISELGRELLRTASETVAIALSVAHSRAATERLLEETQRQATQLRDQEEELRSRNEELRCQEEELRQANEELAAQRSSLQDRNAELEEIGRRLEEKAEELATVSAYKSQFLANMSHELRTPLNSMLLLSKFLEENGEGNLTPKQTEYARTVHAAGRDLLLLINQVLDLAKIESGKQAVKVEEIAFTDLVDRLRRTFGPLARDKHLRLEMTLAPDLPLIIATDGQRLGQILTNLLGNAIKFTDEGAVTLRIERARDARSVAMLAFVVRDTGPGIDPMHHQRIFEPFEQVDGSSRRKQGGTGLGLGIARELAGLLGGELRLESVPGSGSTFTCVLPEHGPSTAQPARGRSGPEEAVSAPPSERRPSSDVDLLVIEDDAVFCEGLGGVIESRGLVHLVARDGKTGLRLARERRPRGIILDVRLPDMDGWRVMDELRLSPETSAIPVHFISGVEMMERGLAMGAVGYLVKPAERSELVRVVEQLAPSNDGAARAVLVIENDVTLGAALVGQLSEIGIVAVAATTGAEAFACLEEGRFACMVVDLDVPDVTDLALLERIKARAAELRSDPPAVVVYTSRPLTRAEATRLDGYAEAVVLKEGASTDRLLDEIRLFIRRLEAGAPRRHASKPRLLGAAVADVKLAGKTLLVVDDDMRTVYALSAMLRARGADVLIADTGAVALEILDERPDVSAVLMDVMMPEMDGYEATRRIRTQPRFAGLPIIALTAKAMKGDAERCIEAGATDYLPKPVDLDALLAVLCSRLAAA